MIIRQFLAWTRHDSATRRAEAATHLARAFLYGGLCEEEAWDARTALIGLLDDPARQVRMALALACASSASAPRALIVALASDHADIAAIVLARSPVLSDADLVDGVAIGCETVRAAIAGRPGLSYAVAGALAELGEVTSLVALAANHEAEVTTGSLLRMVVRHGEAAPLREALLARPDLPLEVRQMVGARLAETLAAFAVASGWLTPVRSARASREARERATLAFSVEAHPTELARLVTHLRRHGELNAGLMLRAILSGRMAFVEAALSDLTGLNGNRVAGLMLDSSGAGFAALHRRAGLPDALLPAFAGALSAWREAVRGQSDLSEAALSRRMIERALTACETMPFSEAASIMALLSRYEAEAAREEARPVAQAIGEVAQAEEQARHDAEVVDAEWRDAKRQIAEAPDYADLEATASQPDIALDPIAAVLDALPGAILTEFTQSRSDEDEGDVTDTAIDPVSAVLDALPGALLSEFTQARFRQDKGDNPGEAEDTIPEATMASYQADNERLAA